MPDTLPISSIPESLDKPPSSGTEKHQSVVETTEEIRKQVAGLRELNEQEVIQLMEKKIEEQRTSKKSPYSFYREFIETELPAYNIASRTKIAYELIETGRSHSLLENLEKFAGIDHEPLAMRIIQSDQIGDLMRFFEKLRGVDEKKIATAIVEKIRKDQEKDRESHQSGIGSMAQNIDKFHLDRDLAATLITIGVGYIVTKNFEKFTGLDRIDIAWKLIKNGQAQLVVDEIEKYSELDLEKAILQMIESGQDFAVSRLLKKCPNLRREDIAIKMIEAGKSESVMEGVKSKIFSTLSKDVFLKILNSNMHWSYFSDLSKHLHVFQGLDNEVALKLIEKGNGDSVADNLEKFQGLNHHEIALLLIEKGAGRSVARNLEKFQGLNHKEIALLLVKIGAGASVADYFEKFQGLNHQEIALLLIDNKVGGSVARNLGKFQGLNHKEIALLLVKIGAGASVADYFEKFQGLNHQEIASLLINHGEVDSVAENLKKFQGFKLNKEQALKLIETKESIRGYYVALHLDSFQGLDKEVSLKLITAENESENVIEATVAKNLDKFQGLDREVFEALKNQGKSDWNDEQNIFGPFVAGAEVFGYERMFQYINRPKLTRHDALHNFRAIVKLQERSELEPKKFALTILNQVERDDATYDVGTAHHMLNTIASNIDLDLEKVKIEVAKYPNNKKLSALVAQYPDRASIFCSWKALKKYVELNDILKKGHILLELEAIKGVPGKEKMAEYVEKLAFHPNIGMQHVIEFWREPEKFLGLPDTHTPVAVHNRKKPSNYIEIPHLDLSAKQLTEGLVDGALDSIQVFKPLRIEYEGEPIRSLLGRALGSRSKKISGLARNTKKLFHEIKQLLQTEAPGVTVAEYGEGEKELSHENETVLLGHIRNPEYGLPEGQISKKHYRAQIHLKSDPEGVVAGNDTACCMPFGSGKNNVYTFNPDVALFTIQEAMDDGRWRTIAQSVLSKDMDIKKNIADIVSELSNAGGKAKPLSEILPEDILREAPQFLAGDNVEVAPNAKTDPQKIAIITQIYSDFFAEYLARFGEKDHLSNTLVPIGTANSDALHSLPRQANTFAPLAPVGYSDKVGAEIYALKPEKKSWIGKNIEILEQPADLTQPHQHLPEGVTPLTFEDSLSVAYIEGKAYEKNKSLMEYLWNIENGLIAKDINNSAKNRVNLSLKYSDHAGKTLGYLFAYEGKERKNVEASIPVIYIADLASMKEEGKISMAGGRLIHGFCNLYEEHYLKQGKLFPIVLQARENTSYRIIQRKLESIGNKLGLTFDIEERGSHKVGGEMMRDLIIRPRGPGILKSAA
jgi:hypothetical protein